MLLSADGHATLFRAEMAASGNTALDPHPALSIDPPLTAFWYLSTSQRIRLVRQGVRPETVRRLAVAMGITQTALYTQVGLSRATVHRSDKACTGLNVTASERLLTVLDVMAHRLVSRGSLGAPSDTALAASARWTARWLDTSHPALDGQRPCDWMDTADARALVVELSGLSDVMPTPVAGLP